MNYLLDTHYMFWALADTKKIPSIIKGIITNQEHSIVVSTISFWEVSLKSSLGKLHITGFSPEDLPAACQQIGFDIECLSAEDSSTYHQLKATHHRDPFDRMLIWQAIRNGYAQISKDKDVRKYVSEGLKVVK
jgi:PIN domain nuclease of toxin-antitoxin system